MKNLEINRIAKKLARLYGDDMKKVEGYIDFLLVSNPRYQSSACMVEKIEEARAIVE